MPEQHLKAFLEAVKKDATLQEKLKDLVDVETVVAVAKEAGFAISTEELTSSEVGRRVELSEEELEVSAGGERENIGGKGSCWIVKRGTEGLGCAGAEGDYWMWQSYC